MSFSLSHGKTMDVRGFGLADADLPRNEHGGPAGPIDLRDWFPADRTDCPIDLEIGSGKGTFLVQQAARQPGVNFLGIEWANQFWRFAADRARRHHLHNVRLLRTEAAGFVRNYLLPRSLRQVHIYFPDPWPKKRHHKRRLIQPDFLRELHRVLADPSQDDPAAGTVQLATDHADYHQWMQEAAANVADLFTLEPFIPVESADAELVGTNFERKYRQEGREFFALVLRKATTPG